METKMILAFLVVLVLASVDAKRYCRQDTDCNSLGNDLICVKSFCDFGICSCPRSKVSRWLGSERLFKCVPLKKIGESCSTDGDAGVCAATDSECVDGTCRCRTNYYSIWGGELCVNGASAAKYTGPGESCSSSIGNCNLVGGVSTCASGNGGSNRWHNEITGFDYPTCACRNTQVLEISNAYASFEYIGRKEPNCRNKVIGDFCLTDNDCSGILTLPSGDPAQCTNNKCECRSGAFQNYAGSQCENGTAITTVGTACRGTGSTNGQYCDGSVGLMCAPPLCQIFATTPTDQNCICGPGYATNGNSCERRVVGSACRGDKECEKAGPNAICMDGTCQSGARALAVTMVILVASFLLTISFN